jgi:hypothetical protein
MLTLLIVVAALGVGWFARRVACSPSCRGAAYLWTEEGERMAWERGYGVGLANARGELTETQRDHLAA